MLALRSLFFALLFPGTVTIVVPWLLASPRLSTVLADRDPIRYAGLLPIAGGAAILIRCVRDFAVLGRGTLAPVDPPRRLVVRGLYRYVRNPMYVGVLTLLLGEAMVLRSGAILAWAVLWLLVIHLMVVFYEEPSLERRFGDDYRRYRHAVRRWVPGRPFRGED